MKTSYKVSFFVLFSFVLNIQNTSIQIYRSSTTNPGSITEILYFDYENGIFEYSKGNARDRIRLEIV